MALRYDIALGPDGDLPIESNTLTLAPSDQQHILDCIQSFPGWWKQFPINGVGAFKYLNSSGQQAAFEKNAKMQLTKDGYTVGAGLITKDASGNFIINTDVVTRPQ